MIIEYLLIFFTLVLITLFIYDRFIQKENLVLVNYPIIGRFRYFAHDLRPFLRQYFGDDNAFYPRVIIDWINDISKGKPAHLSFDKFDTSNTLNNESFQMIHSNAPLNSDEMKPIYPILGKKRKYQLQLNSYIYRSAMSLGAISFEATTAMASACANSKVAFNTGEGGFSIHHIPNVKFNFQPYFKYKKVPKIFKIIHYILPFKRLKNNFVDLLGKFYCEKDKRDLYLFNQDHFLFYSIDWNKDLKYFPKPEELDDSFGQIIFQIGSGLYGLHKIDENGKSTIDFDRYKKITSFCRGIDIKLAQGAKQSGGILKAKKNTPTISEIRGVHNGIDLISPNRFPYYNKGKEKEFFDFIETLSKKANGKPVGIKMVISDESNIIPIAKQMKLEKGKRGPDWITIDGGDGGSATAPISLSILYGKSIIPALKIVNTVLNKYNVRKDVKILASSKLYSPHMSARALAHGADAIGNARSIMISSGCIRAGLCSGENGDCPVGIATMKKSKRRAYMQTMDKKIKEISNYLNAHNNELILVSSIAGVDSPSKLNLNHIPKLNNKI